MRPREMLLLGLGGCSAFDVVHILREGRQAVTDCMADLDATRADTDSKVFTRIHVRFTVTGKALDLKPVEQAVKLSAKTYCSASIMLGKVAEITHDFEVVETDEKTGFRRSPSHFGSMPGAAIFVAGVMSPRPANKPAIETSLISHIPVEAIMANLAQPIVSG